MPPARACRDIKAPTQMPPEGETFKTQWTDVARLKDLDDGPSWRRFDERYRPLIKGVALRAGLSVEEAKEAAQETMVAVSKHIGEFVANPQRGSFRGWLL